MATKQYRWEIALEKLIKDNPDKTLSEMKEPLHDFGKNLMTDERTIARLWVIAEMLNTFPGQPEPAMVRNYRKKFDVNLD